MAKIDIAQVLMIVALVQQFVTTLKANYKGTKAQKKAALIAAIRQVLPLVETATEKDLLDNAKVDAAIVAFVEAFLTAPNK